jgi:hypothetical protein
MPAATTSVEPVQNPSLQGCRQPALASTLCINNVFFSLRDVYLPRARKCKLLHNMCFVRRSKAICCATQHVHALLKRLLKRHDRGMFRADASLAGCTLLKCCSAA